MLKSVFVNKDFLTWLVIGRRVCCQPIRSQVWKSCFDYNTAFFQSPRGIYKLMMYRRFTERQMYHVVLSFIYECFPSGCHWDTPHIRTRDKEIALDNICISIYSHQNRLYVSTHLIYSSMFDRPRCFLIFGELIQWSIVVSYSSGQVYFITTWYSPCTRHTADSSPWTHCQQINKKNPFRELTECSGYVTRSSF